MATLEEYAVLSAVVYQDARGPYNVNPLPPGWVEIAYSPNMENNPFTDGFSAGAYQNLETGEIVIAFKGTDFLVGVNNGQTAADLVADLGLATGAGSSQLREAALFYAQIKAANPDATITFTGHLPRGQSH